ncbi:MAG: sulfotransferase family 2 domain-containing protein [Pseudomonadota bacterium]
MIISHRHRFIFIKTKKTASTSIEIALGELCGPDDVITPFRVSSEKDRAGLGAQNYRIDHPLKPQRPLVRRLLRRPERYWHPTIGYYEHMPAWRIRNYVGDEIWNSYFKFAFDRNPWDRQVSWYLYKTKSKKTRPSFEHYMKRPTAYVDNHELYMLDDVLAVDFLGRYENLEDDLYAALTRAGIEEKLSVPKANVTPNKDAGRGYRSYYTPALREQVANWYRPEIELLGYTY